MTFSCIARASSFSNYPGLLAYWDNNNGGQFLSLFSDPSGRARVGIEIPGNAQYVSSTTTNATNNFALYTGVFTSSAISAFTNGTGKATTSSPGFPNVNAVAIAQIIQSGNPTNILSGQIAEAAIWNVALTDAEIASLAAGFTPDQIRPQSLQFYAPLVRDLVDVRGGRTITNVNSATVATHPRIIT